MVGTPPEAHVDRVGYLVEVEAGVFRLQVDDDTPAERRRQLLAPTGVLGAEEAFHALGVEAARLALERPLGGRAGLRGSPRRRTTEENQRADELVVPLLWSPAEELVLLPIFCRLDATPNAPVASHGRFPPRCHSAAPPPSAAGSET